MRRQTLFWQYAYGDPTDSNVRIDWAHWYVNLTLTEVRSRHIAHTTTKKSWSEYIFIVSSKTAPLCRCSYGGTWVLWSVGISWQIECWEVAKRERRRRGITRWIEYMPSAEMGPHKPVSVFEFVMLWPIHCIYIRNTEWIYWNLSIWTGIVSTTAGKCMQMTIESYLY